MSSKAIGRNALVILVQRVECPLQHLGPGMRPNPNLGEDDILAERGDTRDLANVAVLVTLGGNAPLVSSTHSPTMLNGVAPCIGYEEGPVPEIGLDKTTVVREDGLCCDIERVGL